MHHSGFLFLAAKLIGRYVGWRIGAMVAIVRCAIAVTVHGTSVICDAIGEFFGSVVRTIILTVDDAILVTIKLAAI